MGAPDRGRRRSVGVARRPRGPRHDRLPRGREPLRRTWFAEHERRWSRRSSRRSGPGSRRPTCRCPSCTAAGGTSPAPIEGPVLPHVLPRRLHRRRPPTRSCSTATSRPTATTSSTSTPSSRRPTTRLLAWSSDLDGGERYTLRVRDLATGAELPDELTGTSSWGGVAWSAGQPVAVLRPTRRADAAVPDLAPPPRHAAGRRRARHRGARRALLPRRRRRRAASSGSSSRRQQDEHARRGSSRPTIPTAELAPSCGRATADVEYSVDHWGDRFVVLTNLDAPDFRVMTAPLDDPGEWEELLAHVAGRRITSAEPFAGHLVAARVERRPAAGPGAAFRDGTRGVIDFGDEPHDVELGANPEWDTTIAAARVPVADDAGDGLRPGRRRPASGSCASRRRRPTSTSTKYVSTRTWATPPDGTQVPVDIVRHVDTAVDGSARAWSTATARTRRRCRRGSRSPGCRCSTAGSTWALVHPRGGGELGRSWYLDGKLLNKRNTFIDTLAAVEHLVAEGWPTRGARRDPRRERRRAARRGVHHDAARPVRQRRRRGAVRRRRVDDERPVAAADRAPSGRSGATHGPSRTPATCSATRRTTTRCAADYPALYVTAGLNDPRVSLSRAGQVGGQAALGRRRRRTARSSCAPRWAPATAAPAAATTRGAMKPARSRSSSPNSPATVQPRTGRRRAGNRPAPILIWDDPRPA